MRFRSLPTGALVALAASLGSASTSFAAERGLDLAKLLPADTYVYVRADAKALTDGMKGLDLARMLKDPEVSAFLKPFLVDVEGIDAADPVGSALAMLPIDQYLDGKFAFGAAGFALQFDAAEGEADLPAIRVSPSDPLTARDFNLCIGSDMSGTISFNSLLYVEPGPEMRAHVEQLLAATPPELTVAKERIGGTEITTFEVEFPGGMRTTVYADLSGDAWLIGGDRLSFETALKGGPQQSLESAPAYRQMEKRAGGNILFAMANAKLFMQTFSSLIPPFALDEMEILGLDSLRGLAFGVGAVEGGIRESILFALDDQKTGLLSLLDAFGGGFESLDDAPSNTAAFFGTRFDAQVFLARLRSTVKQIAPRMLPELERGLASAEINGMSLEGDFLPAFGAEFSVSFGVPKNGFIPEAVATLELRDVGRFEKLLETAKAMATEQGGVEIRPLPLADGAEGFTVAAQGAPVQPAFCVRGQKLIGAVSALTLKTYLKNHLGNPQHETYGSNSEVLAKVKRALAGPDPKSATFMIYADLQKAFPVAYDNLGMFLPMIAKETGAQIDASLLPMSDTFAPYLSGMALAVHVDQGGISFDAFSPTGMLTTGMGAGAWLSATEMNDVRVIEVPAPMPGDDMDDDSDDDSDDGDSDDDGSNGGDDGIH